MNKNIIKTLALTSAFCFAMCSCANDKKRSASTQTNSPANNSSAQALIDETENSYKLVNYKTLDNIPYLYDIKNADDGGFYALSADTYDSEAEKTITKPFLYKISSDFSDIKKIEFELPEQAENADDLYTNLFFNKNGDVAVYYVFFDNGGMKEPDEYDENFNYEAFFNNQKSTHALCFYNTDGTIKKFIDIDSIISEDVDPQTLDYASNAEMIDSDNVIVFLGDELPYIIKSDGSCQKFEIPSEYTENFTPTLITGSDGNIYLRTEAMNSDYTSTKTEIHPIDIETQEIKDPVYTEETLRFGGYGGNYFTEGYDDYLFLSVTEEEVIGIKADGTTEHIFNWLEADTTSLNFIYAGNDEFYCWDTNYEMYEDDKAPSLQIYKLVRREPGELANRQFITIASFGTNPLNTYICKFNREQDKYRIQSVNYSSELTPEEMNDKSPEALAEKSDEDYNKLKLDIVAGKCPDILMLGRTDTELLGKKGALLDLYTLMDNDTEINRDTLLPNILRSLENSKGNLYSITPNFTVSTLIAKKKLVDHDNWTLQEMTDLYDKMKDASMRYTSMDKQQIFDILINSDSSLVDIENSECHFDTPEFIDLLKFCNKFVDTVEYPDKENEEDYEKYYRDMERQYIDDQSLIENIVLSGDRDLVYDKAFFGDAELSLVGYPTSNDKGGKLMTDYEFSIGANSAAKEGAWEFIKMILKASAGDNDDDGRSMLGYGYSVLKDKFDKQINSMSKLHDYDDDGNLIETTSINSHGMKINVLSKEELESLKNYILNCDTYINSLDADAYSICYEEAGAYFQGEKSAEEAAKMMQNRISLIVSEKS